MSDSQTRGNWTEPSEERETRPITLPLFSLLGRRRQGEETRRVNEMSETSGEQKVSDRMSEPEVSRVTWVSFVLCLRPSGVVGSPRFTPFHLQHPPNEVT